MTVLRRYIREGNLFSENTVSAVGLTPIDRCWLKQGPPLEPVNQREKVTVRPHRRGARWGPRVLNADRDIQ